MFSRVPSDTLNVDTVGQFLPQLVFSPSISSPCVMCLLFSMNSTLFFLLGLGPANFFEQPHISRSSRHAHTWTDLLSGFIAHLPEWKLQQQVLTVIHRGLGLTLSHRAPGFINSSCIVRGICMAIFTSHNYCQSGDRNQGVNRERERCKPFPRDSTSTPLSQHQDPNDVSRERNHLVTVKSFRSFENERIVIYK